MNKIRIIDLFNKIANEEEVPKKIKYRDKEWEFLSTVRGHGYQYYDCGFQDWKSLQEQVYLEEHLNDEIEVIEDTPKKIKKIIIKTNAILNCIKDSETIQDGEYFVIHSDFIIALEEDIKQINDYINRGKNDE